MMDQLFTIEAGQVADTSDDWYTPRWLFDAAGLVFDLDVCAPVDPTRRTCPARRYLTPVEDGLVQPWDGLVWMNPPYSNPAPWVDRWVRHPAGLALVPAASSSWRVPMLRAADWLALLSMNHKEQAAKASQHHSGFIRADGSQVSYPFALMLVARGDARLVDAIERVARVDRFAGGVVFGRVRG